MNGVRISERSAAADDDDDDVFEDASEQAFFHPEEDIHEGNVASIFSLLPSPAYETSDLDAGGHLPLKDLTSDTLRLQPANVVPIGN